MQIEDKRISEGGDEAGGIDSSCQRRNTKKKLPYILFDLFDVELDVPRTESLNIWETMSLRQSSVQTLIQECVRWELSRGDMITQESKWVRTTCSVGENYMLSG